MSTIIHDPAILGGDAIIAGTRMPVWAILIELRSMTIEEILEDRSNLTRENVIDALDYAVNVMMAEISPEEKSRNILSTLEKFKE